ncbi:MAG: glycosyltransferase family 4 protein, partial [Verrucomicrobiota bacterium]
DLSLEAFAKVRAQHPSATFEIAGEGPLLPTLQNQAESLGIADAVEFSGFLDQSELQTACAKAHVFLHPSRVAQDGNQEGVPNSMLEAMATGLPTVATHHGGIPEAITHDESGLLVPEDDLEAFTAEVFRILDQGDLRSSLATGARTAVEAKFSSQAQITNLEAIYREVRDGPE